MSFKYGVILGKSPEILKGELPINKFCPKVSPELTKHRMHIQIIQIGKSKHHFIHDAEAEYLKRLQAFATVKVSILRESHVSMSANPQQRSKAVESEGKNILAALPKKTYLVALDEHGKGMSSIEFGHMVKRIKDFEGGNLTFIIGGPFGLSDHVKSKADLILSFSEFTFTHEIIRVLLLEQIYRAYTIIINKTYHY